MKYSIILLSCNDARRSLSSSFKTNLLHRLSKQSISKGNPQKVGYKRAKVKTISLLYFKYKC